MEHCKKGTRHYRPVTDECTLACLGGYIPTTHAWFNTLRAAKVAMLPPWFLLQHSDMFSSYKPPTYQQPLQCIDVLQYNNSLDTLNKALLLKLIRVNCGVHKVPAQLLDTLSTEELAHALASVQLCGGGISWDFIQQHESAVVKSLHSSVEAARIMLGPYISSSTRLDPATTFFADASITPSDVLDIAKR